MTVSEAFSTSTVERAEEMTPEGLTAHLLWELE